MSEVKFKACDLRASAIVVQEHDFDRVTAERDAALAELSEIKESLAYRGSLICRIEGQRDALQQRLTTGDEREGVLEGLVGEVLDAIGREPLDLDAVLRLRARMRAALKPAEGRLNQCDGCRAGIPIVNGTHRMGKPGGYPDMMGCTAKLYKP